LFISPKSFSLQDDDPLGLGIPSTRLPDGRRLVGVQTPLGLAQPRWTDSMSLWLDGDGFSKPANQFGSHTLKPVYVSAADEQSSQPADETLSRGPRILSDPLETKLDVRMEDYEPSNSVAAALAEKFLNENLEHYTLLEDGKAPVRSRPTEQLRASIFEYAKSPIGFKVLDHSVRHRVKQRYLHDPYVPFVAGFDRKRAITDERSLPVDRGRGVMIYNPNVVEAYRSGTEPDANYVQGDGHETADLTIGLAHDLGHTPWGRAALGLPWLPEPREMEEVPGEISVRLPGPYHRAEETRAADQFENPYRAWAKKPSRRSYFEVDDVSKWRENVGKLK